MSFGFFRTRTQLPVLTARRSHDVAGRSLPLVIKANPRAKRLTLRIEPGGRGLKVTVPPGIDGKMVDDFLLRHEGWIRTKLSLVPDEACLRPGHKVPIAGVPHLIICTPGRGTTTLEQRAGGPVILVYGDEKFAARRVADYLKKRAKADIAPLVAHHTKTIGKKAKSIAYKDTKSRWGSCASDGALCFSWRIMMAPPTVINYLVAHEVAHLVHMDHSPRFWAQCEALCPDMKRAKDWLKRNGSKLQAIGLG